MGNILNNREWTQHQNEEDNDTSITEPSPKAASATKTSSSEEVQQDENKNPSTPIVESTSRIIRRKLSAVVGNTTTEYTRVNSTDSTPICQKVILGSNFDPRSPTSGIVR